jgi:hypothetical protein
MSRARLGATILLVSATLGWLAISPRAQTESPALLSKSIVGDWHGDAIFANPRTNFTRIELEMRFTDYGIVLVRRAPVPWAGSPDQGTSSWTGDYLVLGTTILISPHLNLPAGAGPGTIRLLSVAIENNRLEAAPFGVVASIYDLGGGIQLRRQ